MRVMTFLVVAALAGVGFAGCFGKTDSGNPTPDTNTTTTPTPTTNSTGGTGGTGGSTNTTGGGTVMASKEAVKDTCDFSSNPGGGLPVPNAPACPAKKFTIDAGYTKLTLNVTFATTGGVPAAPNTGVTVKVGSLSCAADSPTTAAKTCTVSGAATPGSAQIEYSGQGAVSATVSVIES